MSSSLLPGLIPPASTSLTSSTTTTASSTTPSSAQSSSSSTPSSTSSSTTPSSSLTSTSSSSTTHTSSSSSSSSTTSLLASSTSLVVQTSNGQVVTHTVLVPQSPSATVGVTTQSNASKSFFQNTGAVAGTFAAVGVVAIILVVFLVTAAYRRRRAKMFDADVAEAAAEAAASSRNPDFEEYRDYSSGHGSGGGMYNYQDVSHGSLAQAPLSHEAYGMSEFNGGQRDYSGIAPGMGAGAVSIRPGDVFKQPASNPYPVHAAAPQPDPRLRAPVGQGYPGWEDAGLGGGGYAVARSLSKAQQSGRTRTSGVATIMSQSSPSNYTDFDHYNSQPPMQIESYANNYKDVDLSHEDAYGGVTSATPANPRPASISEDLPNPFAMDVDSSEDHGFGRRALKVANQ